MDDGSALGVDFSGVVQAVGSKVDHVKPGDSVFGMADGSIRSVLVCHGSLLRKLEPGWGLSVQEAASLPTIFATAHFILRHIADVRAGQTVLIHTATGGLGHILVRMAQDLGARVVATAGSEEKQRYLADELGVDPGLIATSRDAASFSERLSHLVSQVDVAVNTLSGDYIHETLSLLKPDGRFFETGKLAIWTPEEVKSSRPDVEYHVVHLTQPELLSQFLGDLKDALSQGAVCAPRIESFQYPAQLKEAFEHLRNAQHIGKVVLTMPHAPGKRILCPLQSSVDDSVRRDDENRVRDDATYIVTGGNSGLGLVAARVLVDAGALHIVLLSRSGVVRDLDAHVHAEIEKVAAQTGCNLQHWACDVGDKAELERIILHVQRDGMPPIRGVIHAAGVLHDAPFRQQTNSFMEVVMRPKIQGAQNIMDLLKSSLDFLILFSSPAGLIGTVDQANYGAANAVLDAIAGGWRTNGLPVVSVAWGLVVGLGILTQRPPTRALVERLGLVSPDLVYRALGAAIVEATTTAGCAYKMVAPVQWEKLLRPGGDQRALFAEYQRLLALQRQQQPRRAGAGKSRRPRNSTRRTGTTSSANAAQSTFPESLASIETTMRQVLSDVVAVDIPEGSRDTRLDDLGMDSLSSMELGNRLNAAFSGLNLSPMAVHSF
ncbi:KR domain-containing protein, partial [Diaporthe sp. PMI_573]